MPELLLSSVTANGLTLPAFLFCTAASLLLGVGTAFLCMFRSNHSKSFLAALALLPVIVQVVILLVNGNLGTGVAVMGAFSLIRFRSAPGSAREIVGIFLAMAVGLANGMGYIGMGVLFFLLTGGASVLLTAVNFGEPRRAERVLKITLPDDMEYDGLFDDLFSQYTDGSELTQVKTTSLGSLFELQYRIRLKGKEVPKEFLDQLRCRNGNLNLSCGKIISGDTTFF